MTLSQILSASNKADTAAERRVLSFLVRRQFEEARLAAKLIGDRRLRAELDLLIAENT